MKATAALLALAITGASFAAQDTVTFSRKYVEGEQDKYRFSMNISTSQGEFQMSLNLARSVKKVYENGDADIESVVSDMKYVMAGKEMENPEASKGPQKSIARYTRLGELVGKGEGGGVPGLMGMESLLEMSSKLSDKPLKVGATIPFEAGDAKDKRSIGTMKLESLISGVAKIVSQLDVPTGKSPASLKVSAITWVDAATSKLNKVEATVLDLPTGNGPKVTSLKFFLERVK